MILTISVPILVFVLLAPPTLQAPEIQRPYNLLRENWEAPVAFASQSEAQQLADGREALRRIINDSARMESHVRELSRTSSLAGTIGSMRHVNYVEDFWRSLGFRVGRRTYEVPLSYFDEHTSPSVAVCRGEACRLLEMDKPLTLEDERIGGISRAFYTYSRPLSGEFGLLRLQDLQDVTLASVEDIKSRLPGNLVLIQPNETSIIDLLMQIAVNCTRNTGFLLVHETPRESEDEPEDAAQEETLDEQQTYPNGTGAPLSAVTFHLGGPPGAVGDPTTPGYPSNWYAVRRGPAIDWDASLNASVIPISQVDTKLLMESFFPSSSPLPKDVRLRVRWPLKTGYRQVHDSCAEILGASEPDRAVLIGSHRDAWFGGSVDPHSGMATMLEIGRALAELTATGWRPRRTILMCAWDAEEVGLMGSVEWVEEEFLRAGARLVAYFNTDTDIMGDWKMLVQASDQIVDVIDSVLSESSEESGSSLRRHFFYKLDDSSDYFAFTRALGVPACDLSYVRGPRETLKLYDLYHTRYETLNVYKMLDPTGRAHLHLTQSVAALIYTFADSQILPLNMSAFAVGLQKRLFSQGFFQSDSENETEHLGSERAAVRSGLLYVARSALDNATRALHRFESVKEQAMTNCSNGCDLRIRILNDKMMLAQKAFTHHCVFPGEPASVNLLEDPPATGYPPERVAQAIILGLNSVIKILADSFVSDESG